MNSNISVIICCYNSVDRIQVTLNHLYMQALDNLNAEIVIVDNNCSDETIAVANTFWQDKGNPFPLRIVTESKSGLAFARSKGIETCIYENIIFCDDDNWLESDYLTTASQILNDHPEVGIVGGIGKARTDKALPEDFEQYGWMYATGRQAPASGIVTAKGRLYGAGIAGRKKVFEKIFAPETPFVSAGRMSGNLSAGDDDEICCRAILLGYDLYYDERLRFQHWIPQERLNGQYREKLKQGFEPAFRVFRKYKLLIEQKSMSSATRKLLAIRLLFRLLKALVSLNIKHKKWTQTTLYFLSNGKIFYDKEGEAILKFYHNSYVENNLN